MVSKPESAVDLKYRVAMASMPARYYARMMLARTERWLIDSGHDSALPDFADAQPGYRPLPNSAILAHPLVHGALAMKKLVLETTAPFQGLPELVAYDEGLFAREGLAIEWADRDKGVDKKTDVTVLGPRGLDPFSS